MITIKLNPAQEMGTINKNIYGHFSEHLGRCIYQGMFVGENSSIPNQNGMRTDVVEALKNIRVPVLRWPGGCFADEYHWEDGIGPREGRKRMVNTHWGGVVEDNSFGTHEFLELCRQIGCEPYINANVGSGTVREMAEWVEYLNSDGDSTVVKKRWANGRKDSYGVKYWGVGNENWGCGGNMEPDYYAHEYRRYQTYCRNYGDHKLYRIACGANAGDYNWTDTVMKISARYMDALTLHCYTLPTGDWKDKGSATKFDKTLYYKTLQGALKMDELVTRHLQIMDKYDPEHRVGLIVDEWGAWYNVEPDTNPGFLYQQNTMRDALLASMTLDVFNKHCDRVVMTNIAQIVNVLQSVILTEGGKMVLTPTYHVFDLYKAHQDATLVAHEVQSSTVGIGYAQVPDISLTASKKDKLLTVTLSNPSLDQAVDLSLALGGVRKAEGRLLTGAMDAYNDFDHQTDVAIQPLTGIAVTADGIGCTLPPCSVAELTLAL
ncbi:MAG TPA: alpha-L-arabinofuranosidase C-terminal domain-containing protein [Candidatus Limiplasma sp.]|nr:alpha-L-arabinofuranosidase C-terminal domain-containing protein [Candidatus Limiplasma sp.]